MSVSPMRRPALTALAAALAFTGFSGVAAAEGELNLYSSRHYNTDERLYSDFEKETGITINRIEGKADALIERIKAEGESSPADVLLTVDAGRMWRAAEAGILQPIESGTLTDRVPESLRHPGGLWYGFSQRARIIFYSKERVANPPTTYEELADPKYKGMVCTRSGSNIYMLSLMSSIIDAAGEEAAKEWATGLYANRARDPQGGDTDQLRAIVSGECDIVISNTYYYVRALVSDVKDLSGSTDQIGWVFPNQEDRGTHVNISVGGVAKNAPNQENAIKFLEYLTSESAQKYFAEGNSEYPVVEGIAISEGVAKLGDFKSDKINLAVYGEKQLDSQRVYDEVGYK